MGNIDLIRAMAYDSMTQFITCPSSKEMHYHIREKRVQSKHFKGKEASLMEHGE